jgi:hypothetical protein
MRFTLGRRIIQTFNFWLRDVIFVTEATELASFIIDEIRVKEKHTALCHGSHQDELDHPF